MIGISKIAKAIAAAVTGALVTQLAAPGAAPQEDER